MKTILILLLFTLNANATFLDKIEAVVNDTPILRSQIKRMSTNVEARRNISPQIYHKKKYTTNDLIKILIRTQLLRNKLSEMGYVVSDDQVESQITSTEQRLGLNRQALLNFLSNNNFSFDEYFELTRASIEYNLFLSRIIQPLVSITEQDVKRAYFSKHANQKRLSFEYELVDFVIEKKLVNKAMLADFKDVLSTFQKNGILPERFSEVQTHDLGNIKEDSLNDKILGRLKKTEEGTFSDPLLLGGDYHVFYVKKKDLVESDDYLSKRNKIRAELFQDQMMSLAENWFTTEANKNFIKRLDQT
jgi:peptidyl-prolyl cis-trans isomerase SurA